MYSVFTVKLTIYIQWIRKITETSWVTIFWELHNLFLKIDATFLLKYLLIFPNPLDILQRKPYFIKWSTKGGGGQKIWFMNDPLAFLCLEPLCFERSVASKSFLGKSSFLWKPYITHTGGEGAGDESSPFFLRKLTIFLNIYRFIWPQKRT